jgi:UDP-3-O-[3-hydroxymyristoyl] glucosamine N-acyltransferase
VPEGVDLGGKPRITVARPYVALAELLAVFHPPEPLRPGVSVDARVAADAVLGTDVEIGAFAIVDRGATIGDRARIGGGCYVGAGARIGAETVLHPGVSVYGGSVVGERCILHSGVVVGADGFGFATDGERHRKIPQVARAVVGDDVEIGANTTIDRGALEDTVIGSGSKIDDLVMIAHGVRIGEGCLLTAQTGVAGSTVLGDRVTMAGQSGVAGHVRIGDRVVIAAKSAVFSDVANGSFVAGIPAVDHRVWKRAQAAQRQLPLLRAEVRRLREHLLRIESMLGHRTEEGEDVSR